MGGAVGTTHHVAVTTSGATIAVAWDSVQKIQATDSFQQTKTVHGVIWAPWVDAVSTFDNFQVSGTPPAPPVATTVTVTPATASVGVAATRTLTAVVRDQFNQPMANQAVTWTATANGVVTLAPTGLTVTVTGASVGSATVTATSGALTGTATVTVTAAPPPNTNQVFDSFTAADGSVAGRTPETNAANSTWQMFGPAGVAIQNNALHVVGTPTGYSGAVVNAGIADATIEMDWTIGSADAWGGPVVRYQDALNFLVVRYYQGNLGLYRYAAGGFTALGSATVGGAVGTTHHVAVTTSGATIAVAWDSVQKIQATDSFQQTRTVHGVIWAPWVDAASTFDNFQVSGTPPAPPVATTVTVTPATASVGVAATRTLTAVVRDQFNQPMANQAVTWTATANGVVTLAPTGLTVTVTGASVGSATVTATSGALTGTATVTVTAAPPPNTNQVFDSFTAADGSVAGRTPETNAANSTWQVFGPAGVAIAEQRAARGGDADGVRRRGGERGDCRRDDRDGLDHWQRGRVGGPVVRYQDALNFLVVRYCPGISDCTGMRRAGLRRWGARRWAARWGRHHVAVTTSGATDRGGVG